MGANFLKQTGSTNQKSTNPVVSKSQPKDKLDRKSSPSAQGLPYTYTIDKDLDILYEDSDFNGNLSDQSSITMSGKSSTKHEFIVSEGKVVEGKASRSILTKTKNKVAETDEFSNDDEIAVVTEQLKMVQETQEVILGSLRTDIDLIQTDNALLEQNNLRLQEQVNHLNQTVDDLKFDLRQMRDTIRSKLSIVLADRDKTNRNTGKSRAEQDGKRVNKFQDEMMSKEDGKSERLLPPRTTQGQRPVKNRAIEGSKMKDEDGRKQNRTRAEGKQHTKSKDKIGIHDISSLGRGKYPKSSENRSESKSPEKTSTCFGKIFKSSKKSSKRNIESSQQ